MESQTKIIMLKNITEQENEKLFLKNSKSFTGAEKGTEFKDLKWSKKSIIEAKEAIEKNNNNATEGNRIEAVPTQKQKQFAKQMQAIKKVVQLQLADKRNKIDKFRQLPIRY